MRSATRVVTASMGALAGLVGVEHGIGAAMQGNAAPQGVVFLSWPDSAAFDILAGEPAMTLVPNLLISGVLAITLSLAYLVWAVWFAGRRFRDANVLHGGGLVLIGLAVAMLLVGGGFGPPLLGIIVGAAATRINAPLAWWRRSPGVRRALGALWPWALGACLAAWLLLLPGTVLIDMAVGVERPEALVPPVGFASFGLLFVAILTAQAHDAEKREAHAAPHPPRGSFTGRTS
jgi:hypothetical protein